MDAALENYSPDPGNRMVKQIWLKLNPSKREGLYLSHGGEADLGIQLPALGRALLMLIPMLRSPGVILDTSLSMETEVPTAAKLRGEKL